MATAYVALGSNLGDRIGLLRRAVARMNGLGTVAATSAVYETDPVGYLEQPQFLNAVVQLETNLPPQDLMTMLLGIELDMGRVRTIRHGPRSIDLDLLFYDQEILAVDHLTLPHPGLHERGFVLVPLAEIAPDLVHPVLHRTARELLDELDDKGGLRPFGRLDDETAYPDDGVGEKEREQ